MTEIQFQDLMVMTFQKEEEGLKLIQLYEKEKYENTEKDHEKTIYNFLTRNHKELSTKSTNK